VESEVAEVVVSEPEDEVSSNLEHVTKKGEKK
jgi:hypothetical protein